MSDWMEIGAVKEVASLSYAMWQKGWDEANGGNITYILTESEAQELKYVPGMGKKAELLGGIPDAMRKRYVLVTATGSYFSEIKDDIEHLLGIIYLPAVGDDYEIVAGLIDNKPTSELPAHIQTHAVRLGIDSKQRVVMHNHATHILAMTHAGSNDERDLTIALWRMITEGVVVFPDGVGLVPWCVCGTAEIARATNEKMKQCRCVVWQYHGVFTTGQSMHDAFGLLETVDKCAEVWLLSRACGQCNLGIDDAGLKATALYFKKTLRQGYLP